MIGEKTSHSYWSWTHGPRGTSHDTSGKRSWGWRSSRRTILPPTGCRDEVFWRSRSRDRGDGGTKENFMMGGVFFRGFCPEIKYSLKGGTRGGALPPGGHRARPTLGRTRRPPRRGMPPFSCPLA